MAVPFAVDLRRDLENDGLVDEAEEYLRFIDTWASETTAGCGPG